MVKTNNGESAAMVWQGTVTPPTSVMIGSIPIFSTKNCCNKRHTLTRGSVKGVGDNLVKTPGRNTKATTSTRVDGNRARAAKDLSSHLECDGTEE